MSMKIFLYAALLSLMPFLAMAQTNYVEGNRVVKSFHVGPEQPGDDACDGGRCARPCYYNPPPCPYCLQCNYQHWCPYCGFCPMYDEINTSQEYQVYRADWPSRRDDAWIDELERY